MNENIPKRSINLILFETYLASVGKSDLVIHLPEIPLGYLLIFSRIYEYIFPYSDTLDMLNLIREDADKEYIDDIIKADNKDFLVLDGIEKIRDRFAEEDYITIWEGCNFVREYHEKK